jgi:acetyl-CoA carboxylase biotin carboxyl carrier protein
MSIDHDEVAEILRHLSNSDFAYLRIEADGLTLIASKQSLPPDEPASPPAGSTPAEPQASQPSIRSDPSTTTPIAPTTPSGGDEIGMVAVVAPMVGTFYVSASPGADPFVGVGQLVHAHERIALIEAMKMFSAVEAPVTGTIERRLTDNAEFVEFGQKLFMIRPVADADEPSEP